MNCVLKRAVWAKSKRLVCACLLSVAPMVYAAEADRATVYDEVRSLLQAGNASAAYELLLRYEVDWSGEPDYDYLLGIAALDSGETSEAIFSLQRVIAAQPEFSGGRLELARAYFEIGDNELARTEFEQILTEDPPENVLNATNDYLTAIDARARAYTADIQYTFDFGFGYDTNTPAATAEDVFLNFQLSPNNLEQDSMVFSTALGAVYNRPLSPDSQLLLSARVDHKATPSTHFVDSSNADVSAGWTMNRGVHTVSVSANYLYTWLDRDGQKDDIGVTASYIREISDTWSVLAYGRASQVRYEDDALKIQDVDRLIYGVSLVQAFSGALLNISFTGGVDDADQSGSPFSLDTYGFTVSNTWYRPGGNTIFADATWTTSEYDEPFFGIDRTDDLMAFSVGATLNKFPARNWVTTFRVGYSEKDSDVSLYEFDRVETGITLQRAL